MKILLRLISGLVLLVTLTACADNTVTTDLRLGHDTPEAAVTAFLTDLNLALNDTQISADREVRQNWANRLAGHFAPRERYDQRLVLRDLLDGFVAAGNSPARGDRVEMIITFTRAAVMQQTEETALVDVIDGLLVVRWRNAEDAVVLERSAGLLALIGHSDQGLPTVRVDNRWYMTEGF